MCRSRALSKSHRALHRQHACMNQYIEAQGKVQTSSCPHAPDPHHFRYSTCSSYSSSPFLLPCAIVILLHVFPHPALPPPPRPSSHSHWSPFPHPQLTLPHGSPDFTVARRGWLVSRRKWRWFMVWKFASVDEWFWPSSSLPARKLSTTRLKISRE